jgi:hypothetical protein
VEAHVEGEAEDSLGLEIRRAGSDGSKVSEAANAHFILKNLRGRGMER